MPWLAPGQGDCGEALLQSDKDRREHELVVKAITEHLQQKGLSPDAPDGPNWLAMEGLCTSTRRSPPPPMATSPSPWRARCIQPRRWPAFPAEAMTWLRNLEPFERGGYAAPVGWIDSAGDAELRVAIRCGHARGHRLDLTAGAGLVRGSLAERELQEVGSAGRVGRPT